MHVCERQGKEESRYDRKEMKVGRKDGHLVDDPKHKTKFSLPRRKEKEIIG